MQPMSWPNRVTILRILLIGPFVVALLHLQDAKFGELARYLALAIYVLMAISDGLDGYLARKLKQESALGRFLDPLADKVLVFCSVVLLAHPRTQIPSIPLPATVAVIAVAKDLIVILGFCVIYFATSKAYIDPRGWGKWCTATQLVMVVVILLSPDLPSWLQGVPRLLWWVASGLAIATAIHYCRLGVLFMSRQEQVEKGS